MKVLSEIQECYDFGNFRRALNKLLFKKDSLLYKKDAQNIEIFLDEALIKGEFENESKSTWITSFEN